MAQRLGRIPPNVDVGHAHRLLEAQLPADRDAQRVDDSHEALVPHGQRRRFWPGPACARCPALDLYPTGQARLGTRRG